MNGSLWTENSSIPLQLVCQNGHVQRMFIKHEETFEESRKIGPKLKQVVLELESHQKDRRLFQITELFLLPLQVRQQR
ncbi:hypothetical protein JTB14_008515 [Gonioctena quinquepunctata]|nr:hypothetical protein JTB14_008515 [Gonioctena quinquepunctata]